MSGPFWQCFWRRLGAVARGAKGLALGASLLALARPAPATEYQPLPSAAPEGFTAEWLIHDVARNRLVLFLPDYHAPAHVYYQFVRLRRGQAFPLSFAAQPGLSLFLDNQLVFTARRAATYSLNLGQFVPPGTDERHLLAVWQPTGYPSLASFRIAPAVVTAGAKITPLTAPVGPQAQVRLPAPPGQNIFLGFLLFIGLCYGGIRRTYQSGLARVFQVGDFFGPATDQQGFLTRPAFSLLNLALVLLFALSFALLLTAIHTDLQNLPLLREFFHVPESALVVRVLLYTAIIVTFVLGKYLFLELLAYIFDVQGLVNVQYREFLRTTLWASLTLPVVLLLYLSLNAHWPRAVALAASGTIALMLMGTLWRVARALHQRVPLSNLHLFAYLCATEVLPLSVLLWLIVFS